MVPGIKNARPSTWSTMTQSQQTSWVKEYCSQVDVTLLEGAHRQAVCAGEFEGAEDFEHTRSDYTFRIVDQMPGKYMWLFGAGKWSCVPIPGWGVSLLFKLKPKFNVLFQVLTSRPVTLQRTASLAIWRALCTLTVSQKTKT